jgi:uncharacterized protein with HEPN domain
MNRDYRLYLDDILNSIKKIEIYIAELTFDEFKDNDKTVDAVIRNFEIIGEASKNVPDDFREKYPAIPWREMSSMRNLLIHNYFGVDKRIIYKTATEFLLSLKKQIINLINSD